jgi:hypothetical protein
MTGIQFTANLATNTGDMQVSYLVRHQDLEELEAAVSGAWLSPQDLGNLEEALESKRRPNPIREVANKHHQN